MLNTDGIVLGFDVGTRRIGVAVGSRLAQDPRGIAVISVHDFRPDWDKITQLYQHWCPVACIVGDPLTFDGTHQASQNWAHTFAQALYARYHKTTILIDERRSSIEAAERFAKARAHGTKRRKDYVLLDAMAAAIILERWFLDPQQGTIVADTPFH